MENDLRPLVIQSLTDELMDKDWGEIFQIMWFNCKYLPHISLEPAWFILRYYFYLGEPAPMFVLDLQLYTINIKWDLVHCVVSDMFVISKEKTTKEFQLYQQEDALEYIKQVKY